MRHLTLGLALMFSVACSASERGMDAAHDRDGAADAHEAEAHERPPADAMPLSFIVQMLEGHGYQPIVEIEFEEGVWDVEAYEEGALWELEIDPVTGEVLNKESEGDSAFDHAEEEAKT